MKFFIAVFLVAASIAQCLSAAVQTNLNENEQGIKENLDSLRVSRASYGAPAPAQSYSAPAPAQSYAAPAPAQSYAAPAPTYSAPPCSTNYLFSCGPHVQPVPCSQGGHQGAYSQKVPQYLAAPRYAPRFAYPQYAVPFIREV